MFCAIISCIVSLLLDLFLPLFAIFQLFSCIDLLIEGISTDHFRDIAYIYEAVLGLVTYEQNIYINMIQAVTLNILFFIYLSVRGLSVSYFS